MYFHYPIYFSNISKDNMFEVSTLLDWRRKIRYWLENSEKIKKSKTSYTVEDLNV